MIVPPLVLPVALQYLLAIDKADIHIILDAGQARAEFKTARNLRRGERQVRHVLSFMHVQNSVRHLVITLDALDLHRLNRKPAFVLAPFSLTLHVSRLRDMFQSGLILRI